MSVTLYQLTYNQMAEDLTITNTAVLTSHLANTHCHYCLQFISTTAINPPLSLVRGSEKEFVYRFQHWPSCRTAVLECYTCHEGMKVSKGRAPLVLNSILNGDV